MWEGLSESEIRDGLAVVEIHYQDLMRIVKRIVWHPHLVDEAWSHCVLEKVPYLLRNWDPNRGELWACIRNNITLWLMKWRAKYYNQRCVALPEDLIDNHKDCLDLETNEEVSYLLEQLDSDERVVFEARILYDMTYKKIGRYLAVSRNTARDIYLRAERKLQRCGI